jgi:hypothetical protein
MSEQDREQNAAMSDDPDVEGHRQGRPRGDEGSEAQEAERRATDDESDDVEAHRMNR